MAKEEKEEEAKGGDGHGEAAAPAKSKKKLIIIVAVVVVVLGVVAFLFLGKKKPEATDGAEHETHAEEERHLATAELPSFIVNLSETTNFLKVKLLLEYDPEILAKASAHAEGGGGGGHEAKPGEGLPGALGARQPMIQDAVIKVLSAKKAADVLTIEGKETIKEELVEAINEATGLEEPPIVSVYFMEFIVQ